MLIVESGKSLIANYSENGHVTKDVLPPDNGPRPGNYTWFLAPNTASQPNPIGTYGNAYQNGQVVGVGNFDDGVCAEDATKGRAGPRQCQSVVSLPDTLIAGTYQLVWLWNFPKVDGVVEMYSSCMDVRIEASIPQPIVVNAIPIVRVAASPATGTNGVLTKGTSTLYDTTSVYTTVPSPNHSQVLPTMLPYSPNIAATPSMTTLQKSTMPNDSMPTVTSRTIVTQSTGAYTTTRPIVHEEQANPLFDANNLSIVTAYEVVTVTAQ